MGWKNCYLGWWSVLLLASTSPAIALSPDESLLLDRARAIAAAPTDDFAVLGRSGTMRDAGYRYQLAFLSYGLCSVAMSEPALRDECRKIFTQLLEKMEHSRTLAYWKRAGYEGDGLSRDNVMYRGHLNLMYALAHDRFGETRFDERFHALSSQLFQELTGERPICCEPDHLFIQCNSVTALSLWLHDRAFGTSFGSAGKKLLEWARRRMPLEGTSLVREDFRPSTGTSSAGRAGYANAWAIAFLAPVPGLEREAQVMYADWRRVFVEPSPVYPGSNTPADRTLLIEELLSSGLPAITRGLVGPVKGAPAGETLAPEETLASALLSTTYGLIAARAEGDEPLHDRLARTVACAEALVASLEPVLPPERRAQARTFRAIALFARTFRSWNEILHVPRTNRIADPGIQTAN